MNITPISFYGINHRSNLVSENKVKSCEVNNCSNPVVMPSYLSFKANFSQADKLLSELKSNDTDPSILSRIESLPLSDKEEFIRKYCNHTGFPNLDVVNKKMKDFARDKILSSAQNARTQVISAGYHRTCSANINAALPGSDLDAMSVILKGNQDNVDRFKGELWNSFDPSIVSIRKDFEFPDVYTIDQLYEWTKLTDSLIEEAGLDEKENRYKENLYETDDYEKALEFNIDIARLIEQYSPEELAQNAPSVKRLLLDYHETPKNITQSMSSLLETLRSGHPLIRSELTGDDKEKMDYIKNSFLYRYGNICIQEADMGIKDKLVERKEFESKDTFNQMDTNSKLDLILRMLYESYPSWSKAKVNEHYAIEFDKMFDNGEGVNEKRNKAFRQAVDS